MLFRGKDCVRGIRTHSAGVRPLIAIESTLVVLGCNHRLIIGPISKHVKRYFLSFQVLFDYQLRARFAETLGLHELLDRASRLISIFCNDDAFARGEAVSLDDDGEFRIFDDAVTFRWSRAFDEL